jgi:hypothetical protein
MAGEIDPTIKNNSISVIVMPNTVYNETLKEIVSAALEKHGSLCYISLNKPYNSVISYLEKNGVGSENIIFIDAVTKKIESDSEQVIYVSSPTALTEINITMNKVLEAGGIKVVLIDSISTLLLYTEESVVLKFVHSIVSKMRSDSNDCIMAAIEDESTRELIDDMSMFVDEILELGRK